MFKSPSARMLRVAFVNNMRDAAFADIERQIVGLLERAAPGPLLVDRYLVESVPRPAAVLQGPAASYRRLRGIYATRPDAVIVTGTEPGAAAVASESLEESLTELFGWALDNTSSLLCSGLAARLGVRHLEGLEGASLDASGTTVTTSPHGCLVVLAPGDAPSPAWGERPYSDWLAQVAARRSERIATRLAV